MSVIFVKALKPNLRVQAKNGTSVNLRCAPAETVRLQKYKDE